MSVRLGDEGNTDDYENENCAGGQAHHFFSFGLTRMCIVNSRPKLPVTRTYLKIADCCRSDINVE
jgi:hypothetical protein